MMNSSLEKRKRVARKAIEETVNKGEKIGGTQGRLKALRDLLRHVADENEHPENHFDIISNEDLLELYAEIIENARDRNLTEHSVVLSSSTLQGSDSIRTESKGQSFVPPLVPMPPTGESGQSRRSETEESEQVEDGEELPSYEEDVSSPEADRCRPI
jgi:hypothetical protein